MSLPTLEDLKAHLNQTTAQHDDELTEMLDAAIDVVENIAGPIDAAPVTEVHRGVSSGVLILRRMPVTDLVSIASRYGSTTTALTLGDYELDVDTGIVRSVYGAGFSGDYTVTYTAGRDTLPASIRLAVLEMARHLWTSQRGGGNNRPSFPGEGDVDLEPTPGFGYLVPNRVRELLEPFVAPRIA